MSWTLKTGKISLPVIQEMFEQRLALGNIEPHDIKDFKIWIEAGEVSYVYKSTNTHKKRKLLEGFVSAKKLPKGNSVGKHARTSKKA